MIKVCDAIMGTGKSSAAISYMNDHKDQKFIYITPYLDEAARIMAGCPDLRFVEPSNKLKECGFKKTEHTALLIRQGRNITTTHQAFKRYTPETLIDIREHGYTLIIDENVEVLEQFDVHPDDMKLAIDSGYVEEQNNLYKVSDLQYNGNVLRELFEFLKIRDLISFERDGDTFFYWALPPTLLTSFKDVFIMTYMFEAQGLCHFLKIYDIPFEQIGIHKERDRYTFGSYPGYIPDYVRDIKNKIHILDGGRINNVGDDYHALSMSWFQNKKSMSEQLKKNVYNCFRNVWKDIPADSRLWGTYKSSFSAMKGKGYTNGFLTFNARATNEYRDKRALVYIVNLFMNVGEKLFYKSHGVEVDEDAFALSTMVQWIWRSAIRDGEDVYIYIPSKRMRTLLIDWMERLSKGGIQ